MYNWRKMTDEQRDEVLLRRQQQGLAWHGPPSYRERNWYHLSAACYDHHNIIGISEERIISFEKELISTLSKDCQKISAWCVLPNHYHLLVQTPDLEALRKTLGHLHGRTSFAWNREDDKTSRKCWHRCDPREIKSHAQRMAAMNYVHNNPVHHNYSSCWQSWPFSSAIRFLESAGHEQAVKIWEEYPIDIIGENWDEADL